MTTQTRTEQVPATVDQLTPQWVTNALRSGGQLSAGTVDAVTATVIGDDRGFTGVVARLRPAYRGVPAGASPPASLVAKLPTAVRAVPSAYRLRSTTGDGSVNDAQYQHAAREVTAYQELSLGNAAPRLYYAATDPQRRRVVLLMEDLAEGRPGDCLTGCTVDEAAAILDTIAPVHARWWRVPRPAWLPARIIDPPGRQRWYAQRLDQFLARYHDQLPAPARDLLTGLRTSYARFLTALTTAPATIIHGDLHLDNVVFQPANPDRPVVLLDWQGVTHGSAALDVAQVLFGSLPVALRREHEDPLLERYTAWLRRYGVSDYPVTRLRHDCQLAMLNQVVGRVNWLAGADPDQLGDRERAVLASAFGDGRWVAALLDHHPLH